MSIQRSLRNVDREARCWPNPLLKASLRDMTIKGYLHENLAHSGSRDVAAAAAGHLRYQDIGIQRFTGGALSFASHDKLRQYEDVVARGMEELGQLLSRHGII